MSLVFKYGSFTGGQCLVKLVSHNVVPRLTNGYPTSYIRTIAIEGRIEADGPAAISAAMQSLENALNVHGQDGGIYNADGSATKHTILTGQTMYGTTVARVDYNPSELGMATEQVFTVTLQGEYSNGFFPGEMLSLTETISVTGDGGPVFVIVNSSVGDMVRHQVNPKSPITVVQSGTIQAKTEFPSLPDKLITDPFALNGQSTRDSFNIVGIGTSTQKFVRTYSWTFNILEPLSELPIPNTLG